MVIYKYYLKVTDLQTLSIPVGSQILSVANQRGNLCLWCLVDENAPIMTQRKFEVIGTGNPIPDGKRAFIGTVIMEPFVWHVFENLD